MILKKLFSISILVLCMYLPQAKAQDTPVLPLATILEQKAQALKEHPFEKIYLQFDKPYYAVGDTIWFKAYITTIQHVPSPLSKIVYVELISAKDSLVNTLRLPVKKGMAQGSILLNYPDFKEGNYHLRAYTRWMLNDPQDYFFKKNIYVGNAINKQLSPYFDMHSSTSDKEIKVNSTVILKDENLKPFIDKKLSWEVIADDERIARGKETTDNKGTVHIDFSSTQKVDLNRGNLYVELAVNNERTLKASFPLKGAILDNDLQFFPEGGDMVAGIEGKVAFKAINTKGLGVAVKGTLVDGFGKEVATFASQHLGMGTFTFRPEASQNYSAKATFADGSSKTYPLPNVKAAGIDMIVNPLGNDILLRIAANTPYLNQHPNQGFYLLAQNGGVIYYAAKGNLSAAVFTAKIPKDKFPSGITQFTLLADNGLPLATRLVFIQRSDDMKINVKTDLPAYRGRQLVKMDIQTIGGLNMTNGNYSIAVVDENKVPIDENKETTILSSLLLTSDLAGYIEQPNYYFTKVDDQKRADLDVLMLTQGYHRYTYQEILNHKTRPISFLPEQGINISGTIRRGNGLPLQKGSLLLQIPSVHLNKPAYTDEGGRFEFKDLVFQDSSKVIINARNNINSKDLRINTDGEAYPAVYPNVNAPDEIVNLDSALSTYLKSSRLEHNSAFYLQEVVVKSAAVKKPSHEDYAALTGLNPQADREVPGAQLNACAQLTNCLSAAGVTFDDNQLYLTRTYNQGLKVPIAIYVGEMPVDVNYLNTLNPKEISSVEVFNNDGLSNINRSSGTSGILVINMLVQKKVSFSKTQIKDLFAPTNILSLTPKGYAVERHFYVPKYKGPRSSLQREDFRSTIYWNPEVLTDSTGKAHLEFYNGDGKGTYRVTMEGIDENGNFGRAVYRYQVK
ncbi:MAG: carboxypeptidase regulatory-like domain-containing protein [Sphingobacteriales bacterium]|nr:carboxypeptidase regulatory-like domain-containing protein [Sphingobacteriales bacterium]